MPCCRIKRINSLCFFLSVREVDFLSTILNDDDDDDDVF